MHLFEHSACIGGTPLEFSLFLLYQFVKCNYMLTVWVEKKIEEEAICN